MRRRGRIQQSSSLFAFQDVMASVIGILFFVVLLMAMGMTTSSTLEAMPIPDPTDTNSPEILDAQSQAHSLQEEVDHLGRQLAILGGGDFDTLVKIQQLDKSLQTHIVQMKDAEERARVSATQLAQIRKDQEQLNANRRNIQSRRSHAKETLLLPDVTYIIDSSAMTKERKPWLVELAKDRIRVISIGGHSDILCRANDKLSASGVFLAWAKDQKPTTHYFVLLIKPSGKGEYDKIRVGLQKQGFRIGTDLIPEEQDSGLLTTEQ